MIRILNRAPKDPYKRTTYGGHTVNWRTRAMLMVMGQRLYDDPYSLTVYQGSYNSGVSASGGTHDGGGAVDLSYNDHFRKTKVARFVGFRMWPRPELPGEWDEHCHGIAAGDKEMSPAARDQIVQYANHTNGLANHAHDDFPFHPMNVFDYQAWRKAYNKRQEKDWFDMADKADLKEVVDAAADRIVKRLNEVAGNDKKRDQAEADTLAAFREGARKRDAALADKLQKVADKLAGTATTEQVAAAKDELLAAIVDLAQG